MQFGADGNAAEIARSVGSFRRVATFTSTICIGVKQRSERAEYSRLHLGHRCDADLVRTGLLAWIIRRGLTRVI